MAYTTIEAARDRAHWDTDKERQHGPSNNVVTVWDFDGGQSLELTAGELEEYEQAENVLLDEDVIGPERFANLLAWLRDEELLEQAPEPSQPAPAQAQHTSGPWENLEHFSESKHDGHLIVGPNGWGIAKIWHDDRLPAGEIDANARLIASAPELLAALERLYKMGEWQRTINDEMGATVGHAYSSARAAIAKATGAPVQPSTFNLQPSAQ